MYGSTITIYESTMSFTVKQHRWQYSLSCRKGESQDDAMYPYDAPVCCATNIPWIWLYVLVGDKMTNLVAGEVLNGET